MRKSALKSDALKQGELLTRNQMKDVLGGSNQSEAIICQIALCSATDQQGNYFDGLCDRDCYCVSPDGMSSPEGCGRW